MSELVERRKALSTDRFRATSVKIMQDGVAENFTASMTEPYCDGHGHRTDNCGTRCTATAGGTPATTSPTCG